MADQNIRLNEINVSAIAAGVGKEFGIVEIDGKKYSIDVTTGGVERDFLPVDIGTKSISLARGRTLDDLQGFGYYVEGYGVAGGGLILNSSREIVASYLGARSDITTGGGISYTVIKELVEKIHVPVGTVASVRLPGQLGVIEIGTEANILDYLSEINALNNPECFLADTPVSMWPLDVKPDSYGNYDQMEVIAKIWEKPIQHVKSDEWVVSYAKDGKLIPGRVTRTQTNHVKHILDLHGLMMTPGHITYCAKVNGEDNPFADKHVPVLDILRSDGALMKADGTLIRASTGCEIGSEDDEQFWAFLLYEDENGMERVRDKRLLRYGTRLMLPNGDHFSMREYMTRMNLEIIRDGPGEGYARFKYTGEDLY